MCTTPTTNIRPSQDSNLVPVSFDLQPGRMSPRGRHQNSLKLFALAFTLVILGNTMTNINNIFPEKQKTYFIKEQMNKFIHCLI